MMWLDSEKPNRSPWYDCFPGTGEHWWPCTKNLAVFFSYPKWVFIFYSFKCKLPHSNSQCGFNNTWKKCWGHVVKPNLSASSAGTNTNRTEAIQIVWSSHKMVHLSKQKLFPCVLHFGGLGEPYHTRFGRGNQWENNPAKDKITVNLTDDKLPVHDWSVEKSWYLGLPSFFFFGLGGGVVRKFKSRPLHHKIS